MGRRGSSGFQQKRRVWHTLSDLGAWRERLGTGGASRRKKSTLAHGAPESVPKSAEQARTPQAETSAVPPVVDAQAERALFLQAVRGAAPLKKDGRAEIMHPRPEPRLFDPDSGKDGNIPVAPSTRSGQTVSEETLFHRWMTDVQPLRQTRRAEPGPVGRAESERAEAQRRAERLLAGQVTEADPQDADALFRQAMYHVRPLPQTGRHEPERPRPAPGPLQHQVDEAAVLRESLALALSGEDYLDTGDETSFLRPGVPRRVLADLKRGRWVTQAEVDLHGLTRDEARDALGLFLGRSLQMGYRCVRIIHGKGLGSPGGASVLKHLSRIWLSRREEILAFCQALPHQGGAGALVVLLRSRNK